ncbi:MAG TPA: serine hydrolase domain-containing protein [Kofleriaceae bacterium]|nr:serine hydrolase domain-containing protein [Kofleriaceae bacterium]
MRRGLLLIAVAAACHPARPVRSPAPTRIEALFADLHRRGLFDGAVVVARGHQVLVARGYGPASVEEKVRFTPDTPVDGASLAKNFTAAIVLGLAAERRLDLDEPLARRLVPELPYPDITLRHLLSHSSGLPAGYGFFDRLIPAGAVRTTETLLETLARHPPPLAFAPGTRFEYSSFAYDLAALAAARAAGTSVAALFRDRAFAPLGLRSAFLRPGRFADWPGPRTRGYRRVAGRRVAHDVFDGEAFHGGSNIYISARDLARWNLALLERTFLAPSVLEDGLRPARIAGRPSGLSLLSWYRADDDSAFWYCGHLEGFHDLVFRDLRAGISIVYVSNNTLAPWLHHAIVRAVRDVLAGRPPERLAIPAMSAIAGADPTGVWSLDDGRRLRIERAGDALHVVPASGIAYPMYPEDRTSWYVPGLDIVVGVRRSPTGAVERVRVSSNLGRWWAQRRRR